MKANETAIQQYDQALNKLTKGITAMFFIVALVMIASVSYTHLTLPTKRIV